MADLQKRLKTEQAEHDTSVRQVETTTEKRVKSVERVLEKCRSELQEQKNKPAELRSELADWEHQYDWQFGTEARSNADSLNEEKAKPSAAASSHAAPEARRQAEDTQAPLPRRPGQGESESRAREAERIKINTWPKPATYRSWRMTVTDEVAAASTCPRSTFEWMLELQKEGVEYEHFIDPGIGMDTLDAKLASALTHVAPYEFQRIIQARKQEALKDGRMVSGRQILFLVDQRYKMSEADGAVFDTEHLFSVTLKGDRLTEFLANWDQVLAGLRAVPNESTHHRVGDMLPAFVFAAMPRLR